MPKTDHSVVAGPQTRRVAIGLDVVEARAGLEMSANTAPAARVASAAWAAPGTPKPPASELAVLAHAIGSRAVPRHDRPVRLPATGKKRQTYLLYRPAELIGGTWRMPVCGSPYNDGSSVMWLHGGLQGIDHVGRTQVYECGSRPVPAIVAAAAHTRCP